MKSLLSHPSKHGIKHFTVLSGLMVFLTISGCSGKSNELPAVTETRPSQDERVLNPEPLMSDGLPITPYITSTLTTSQTLISDGLIGGMTIDKYGNIYVADLGSHIWKIDPTGNTELFSSEFEDPSGNLALPDGSILQSEWTKNRIYKIAPDGSRTLFSEKNLNGPVAIVQRPDGDFIVANSRGKFLARVPQNGGDAEIVLRDERITQPNGVTIDSMANIYIADLDSGNVFKWTPKGELSSLVELPGRGNAHNTYYNGMLYVTKIWDHVIYQVNPMTGAYGIISGTGVAGYGDGMVGISTIEEPNSITVDPNKQALYFNTHRGRMGRSQTAHIVVRKLSVNE